MVNQVTAQPFSHYARGVLDLNTVAVKRDNHHHVNGVTEIEVFVVYSLANLERIGF